MNIGCGSIEWSSTSFWFWLHSAVPELIRSALASWTLVSVCFLVAGFLRTVHLKFQCQFCSLLFFFSYLWPLLTLLYLIRCSANRLCSMTRGPSSLLSSFISVTFFKVPCFGCSFCSVRLFWFWQFSVELSRYLFLSHHEYTLLTGDWEVWFACFFGSDFISWLRPLIWSLSEIFTPKI